MSFILPLCRPCLLEPTQRVTQYVPRYLQLGCIKRLGQRERVLRPNLLSGSLDAKALLTLYNFHMLTKEVFYGRGRETPTL
jgi:hypothetical protein